MKVSKKYWIVCLEVPSKSKKPITFTDHSPNKTCSSTFKNPPICLTHITSSCNNCFFLEILFSNSPGTVRESPWKFDKTWMFHSYKITEKKHIKIVQRKASLTDYKQCVFANLLALKKMGSQNCWLGNHPKNPAIYAQSNPSNNH